MKTTNCPGNFEHIGNESIYTHNLGGVDETYTNMYTDTLTQTNVMTSYEDDWWG